MLLFVEQQAAIGPKMTQLAGEIADGVIGYFQPIGRFRDTFRANLVLITSYSISFAHRNPVSA